MSEALARNLRRLGHLDMPEGGQVVVADGYAYVGHMKPPYGPHTHKVRVVGDVSDPTAPEESGWYIPEPATGNTAPLSNDVFVDPGGLVYLIDRDNGFDILEPSR